MKNDSGICRRKTCKYNDQSRENGCDILADVYEDNFKCAFFAKREKCKEMKK